MKIKNPNVGALTNFEVLDFLRSRGASTDHSRVIAPVAPSEYKVYEYLIDTSAYGQTREQINEFMEKCKPYKLAKAEILNIINVRPSELVHLYTLIDQVETRLGDKMEELLELIVQVLPSPPGGSTPAGDGEQNDNETADGGGTNDDEKDAAILNEMETT